MVSDPERIRADVALTVETILRLGVPLIEGEVRLVG